MSENVIQTSFAAGELAPSISARTDLAKYHSGAAKMRNFFVDWRSGASSRQGTRFIAQAYDSTHPVRLIKFVYNFDVSYVIEFGDLYCRFIDEAGLVTETAFNITGITNANPMSVTAPGNNFVDNDWIYITGVVGMPQVNGRYFKYVGGNYFDTKTGNPINSNHYGIYTSGGTAARVYKISSPYAGVELSLVKFAQTASVMRLTHPNHPPFTLTITNRTSWVFTPITIGTTIAAPTGLAVTLTGSGATYGYVVTAVDANGQESDASTRVVKTGADMTVTKATAVITWSAVTGATSYNVYKTNISYSGAIPTGAAYGFIGNCTSTTFNDTNIAPDFTLGVPVANNPFSAGNNPACVNFFQERAVYGGSVADPATLWMSQPGEYDNFDYSDPSEADDSIEATIVGSQVNIIKSMVPMPGGLLVLTSQGAWQISSGSGVASTSAVTPSNITAVPQAYNGASDVPPIVVNYDLIYVQAKGSYVRDASYDLYKNIYTGTDISVLSNHLFTGYQILEWAYAEEPFKIVWCVRDDGAALSLTLVKEQEIYGWAQHDTLGQFKSVTSITEGHIDATYFVVSRYIGGQWLQYIERLTNRTVLINAEDAWCVDCGLAYDLPLPDATLSASTSTGNVVFTADSPVFANANVGNVLRMGGGIANITGFTSATSLRGTWTTDPVRVFEDSPTKVPIPALSGEWSIAAPVTQLFSLDHLEGQTVSIAADGGEMNPQVVTDGQITLPRAATRIVVGLAYTAQLQTMYLDIGEPTVQGKRKKIAALTVRSADTRGLLAGRTFDTLVPIKELSPRVILGQPIKLVTGDERVIMDPLWDVPGQICLQQNSPMPATILGVIPEIVVGDK